MVGWWMGTWFCQNIKIKGVYWYTSQFTRTPKWTFAEHNSIEKYILFVVATIGKAYPGSYDDNCLY